MEDEYFAAFGDDFLDDDSLSAPDFVQDLPPPALSAPVAQPTPRAQSRSRPEQSFNRTNALREQLDDGEIEAKVMSVLTFMKELGLNLEIFMDCVFWGHDACTRNRDIVYARTGFLDSPTFEKVMYHLWKPPTRARSHQTSLHDFVLDATGQILEDELKHIASLLTSPKDGLTKENLTSLNLRHLGEALRDSEAPELWRMLARLCQTGRQIKENTMKDPFLVSYKYS